MNEYEQEKLKDRLTKDLRKCTTNMDVVNLIRDYESKYADEVEWDIKVHAIYTVNRGPLPTICIFMGQQFDNKLSAICALAEYGKEQRLPRYVVNAFIHCTSMVLSFESIPKSSVNSILLFVNKNLTVSEKEELLKQHKDLV